MSPTPSACPVCQVIYPGTCRNEAGNKVWPPHPRPKPPTA